MINDLVVKIDRYEECAEAFANALQNVPENLVDLPTGPGKWTIRQIAVHTADAELVFSARIRMIAGQDGVLITAFDQDEWAKNLAYDQQPIAACIALFQALRHSNATMLRNLPESAWGNIGQHNERGPMRIVDVLDYALSHGEGHTRAIREAVGKLNSAA